MANDERELIASKLTHTLGRLRLGFSTLSWNTFLYRGPIQNRAENTRGLRQRIEEHKVLIENLKKG
jgi:hypothetical protein